eukprot:COSAG02_NODE_5738_length_4078_cov_2.919326_1_plen_619_part_00
MFDRFEHGSISWQELRTIASELSFSNFVDALRTEAGLGPAPPLGAAAEDELSFTTFRRLLHSKHVAQQLDKESNHHTATYQYKVIEKVIQMLIHGHVDMTDLSEARLAYSFHSQQAWGIPFDHRVLTAALRLAKYAIAPDQLQTWMDAAVAGGKIELHDVTDDGEGGSSSFIQFYEFLDLFVLCDPIKLDRARVVRPRDPKSRSRRQRAREQMERDFPNSLEVWKKPEVSQQRTRTPHRGESAPLLATSRYDLQFPESEHFFKQYIDGKAKDDSGAYNLAEDDFLMTPSDRLGSTLNSMYETRVREHRRQLLNDRTAKGLQEKFKSEERQKLRGNKVAAKEDLYAEIVAALDESQDTVTASRVAFRPAARRKALDRTHRLRQSLSRAGMAPVAGLESSLTNVRRAQSVGSIGLSTGRGEGGTEWGSAMDDGIKGNAQAIGVGAPPRNPVQKRPTSSPAKHRFIPASVEIEPQWFEADVIDTGGVLPAGLSPHGGGDEAVPEPPSTVPAHVKKLETKRAAEHGNRHQEAADVAGSSSGSSGGRRGRRSRQRGTVGSNAASRANSTLLQKQLATRTRKVKSAPPTGPGGPTLSAASTELSSFALDLNGTRAGVKRYPYFG